MTNHPNTSIVCPHCWAVNRVPTQRLADAPNCGGCHKGLFDRHATPLTGAQFDRFVTRTEIPVLVDFWAPWCGPCVSMAPAFEKAAATLEPNCRLVKVNIDAEPAIAARFRVQSIPTLCLLRQGKEVDRQLGALSEAGIVQLAQKAL